MQASGPSKIAAHASRLRVAKVRVRASRRRGQPVGAISLMAEPEPLGSARLAITLKRPAPEVSSGASPLRHLPKAQVLKGAARFQRRAVRHEPPLALGIHSVTERLRQLIAPKSCDKEDCE